MQFQAAVSSDGQRRCELRGGGWIGRRGWLEEGGMEWRVGEEIAGAGGDVDW